jgi:hypothetical protein
MTAIGHQWMMQCHNDCLSLFFFILRYFQKKASLLLIEQSSFSVGFYPSLQETIDCQS